MEDDDINGLIGDLIRFGTVRSVDLAAGEAVVEVGEVVSPPLPWRECAVGDFRTWFPPSENEQIILLCPEGDIEGGVILRGLFSNAFPAPANGEDPEIHGPEGLIIKFLPDGLHIIAPGDIAIEGNVTITGDLDVTGTATASEDVVGGGISLKNHKHGNVQAGSAKTGGPE